jgi:hypothetical protein
MTGLGLFSSKISNLSVVNTALFDRIKVMLLEDTFLEDKCHIARSCQECSSEDEEKWIWPVHSKWRSLSEDVQ